MKSHTSPHKPRKLVLDAGSQLIVNGALVTALDPCRLELGSGSFVLSGTEASRRKSDADPTRELYFALLKASEQENGMVEQRYHLFQLLAKVVARYRTHAAQRECTLCASALISADHKAAIASARRLNDFHQQTRSVDDPQALRPHGQVFPPKEASASN